jgi:tRNA (cmo5U34)-methyltransferase
MTGFGESDWIDGRFVKEFLDAVEVKIPQRRRMFELARSYYVHFLAGQAGNTILDLGCGDGALAEELLKVDDTLTAVLVDASEDMLDGARERLRCYNRVSFVQSSFEELCHSGPLLGPFDLVASSLAIHHLPLSGKRELFDFIYQNLRPGGHFLNIDTMLPATPELEAWYLQLWEGWMRRHCDAAQLKEGMELMNGHHQAPAHHACLDTLPDQLSLLEQCGFTDVDVVFKDGIFTIYCGRRP